MPSEPFSLTATWCLWQEYQATDFAQRHQIRTLWLGTYSQVHLTKVVLPTQQFWYSRRNTTNRRGGGVERTWWEESFWPGHRRAIGHCEWCFGSPVSCVSVSVKVRKSLRDMTCIVATASHGVSPRHIILQSPDGVQKQTLPSSTTPGEIRAHVSVILAGAGTPVGGGGILEKKHSGLFLLQTLLGLWIKVRASSLTVSNQICHCTNQKQLCMWLSVLR